MSNDGQAALLVVLSIQWIALHFLIVSRCTIWEIFLEIEKSTENANPTIQALSGILFCAFVGFSLYFWGIFSLLLFYFLKWLF